MTAQRLLPFINYLLEHGVAITAVESLLMKNQVKNAQILAAIYRHYRNRLKAINCLDFASLILETLELLTDKLAIQKVIPRIYTHICVDEFQYINLAQYQLLKQLVPPDSPNLLIVADDTRIKELRHDFDLKELQLPENYRCPMAVLEIANRLQIDKLKLLSAPTHSGNSSVRIEHFATFDKETDWVAKDISSRPVSELAEVVVLARNRKLLDSVVQALQDNGLNGYVPIVFIQILNQIIVTNN